jgi:membrane protein implicated in regulation of membrane protease activity
MLCSAAFFIIGLKILFDDLLLVKGMLSMVCSAILALMLLQKPSLRTWLQIVVVIAIAVMIVGELKKI